MGRVRVRGVVELRVRVREVRVRVRVRVRGVAHRESHAAVAAVEGARRDVAAQLALAVTWGDIGEI